MEPKIGIGHNNPPGDEALPIHVDAKDLKAAKTAARQLPENFSLDDAKCAVEQHIVKRKEAPRSARVELREAMQSLFGIYVSTAVSAEHGERLKSACLRAEITLKSGTDLAIAVVRYYWRDLSAEAANRYANVLREAALLNVPPNKLAAYLGKQGQGVNELSRANQQRRHPPAAKDSDTSDESDEVDDVSESEPDDSDSDDVGGSRADASDEEEEEEDEPTPEDPQVVWGSKALKQYREADVDAKWRIVLKKVTENQVRIMKGSLDKG